MQTWTGMVQAAKKALAKAKRDLEKAAAEAYIAKHEAKSGNKPV